MPLHTGFPTIVAISLAICVGATLATPPVEDRVLVRFYTQVAPWGFWRKVMDKAMKTGQLSLQDAGAQLQEKVNDAMALFFAVPFQLALLLAGMAFVFHDWLKLGFFGAVVGMCGVGLYFFWYKWLKSPEVCQAEDEAHRRRYGEGFEVEESDGVGAALDVTA